jgi:hypothetical protein
MKHQSSFLSILLGLLGAMVKVFALLIILLAPLSQCSSASAEPSKAFITFETEGKGPRETIKRFLPAPGYEAARLPSGPIKDISSSLLQGHRQVSQEKALALGMQVFGDTQGSFAAIGTLAEHALFQSSFSNVNNALNNVGLMFAAVQVARDAMAGNKEAAIYGGLKSWMNYAVGRWGWGSLQVGGVAIFVFDITLREWQAGLTELSEDIWRCRYRRYYQENGRSVNDWKVKLWSLYLEAEKSKGQPFGTYIDGVLNEYVSRAFDDSADLALYSDCGTSSMGDRQFVQDSLKAEYKQIIEAMLVKKVLPEIARMAWRKTVLDQVARANFYLKPDLNESFELMVTVYDLDGPARVVLPLVNGKAWSGSVRANGTFKTRVTKFALMKAGFPDIIKLQTEAGEQQAALSLAGDRLIAMFGTPKAQLISRLKWEEGPQECVVRRLEKNGAIDRKVVDREPRPVTLVDMAQLANGTTLYGQYDGKTGTWSLASPAIISDSKIDFGPPYMDHIQSVSGCQMGFLVADKVGKGSCRIERFEKKQVSSTVTIERRCHSDARITLVGAFSRMGDEMRYVALDGQAGKILTDQLREGLIKGTEGFDPSMLNGSGLSIPGLKQ